MNSFLANFSKYFPLVLSGVIALQQSAASELPGTSKKQIFMDSIIVASKIGEQIPESHIADISTVVDSVVSSLHKTNSLGFGTSSTPTLKVS